SMKSVPEAEWNCELDYRLIKQVRGPPLEPQRLVNPDARAPIGIEDDRAGVVLGQSALDLPQDLLAARNITLDGLRRYQHVDLLVAVMVPIEAGAAALERVE